MIVILYHREGHHVTSCRPLGRRAESLDHGRASVWEVSVDGQMGVVLELKLLLLLPGDRDLAIVRPALA